MSGALIFAALLVLVPFFLVIVVYGDIGSAKKFWATKKGKNVFGGIAMFCGLGLLVAALSLLFSPKASAESGSWFKYGEIYLGIDNTFKSSPQCKKDQYNERLTSNGGFLANIYQSYDGKFEANLKYQHHSCAFNQDDLRYDAFGIEFTYLLWGSK
ncbi:MAG: hypothetical protein ACRBCS_03120 [Cellvibrionaceae bacterium]